MFCFKIAAFVLMIILTLIRLANSNGIGYLSVAQLSGIPVLFGTCVYTIMCYHSLPSIVMPLKHKTSIQGLCAIDFLLILFFYALLRYTGMFAFGSVCDLYTLNFLPNTSACNIDPLRVTNNSVFQYFLALFPVFTLTTSYSVLGITLHNNKKTLRYKTKHFSVISNR